MKKILVLTSLLAVAFATSASASPISISGGGTFSASTASSPFTGPSQPWNFAFLVDSHPIVSNVNSGSFDAAFSNFSYVLNGSPVAITPVEIKFFDTTSTGMFAICVSSACGQTANGLQFAGPQMYSGATSAPTILTGNFPSDMAVAFFGTTLYFQANLTVQAATVPEPMTLLLMGAGLLGLGFLRRYRKI